MAALLVALAVMAILLTVAIPVWKTAIKREKEAELVWRAGQYVRAVLLFRRKYANASPPNLDILVNEHFLRKKYKDPMTKDGEFQLVYATDQQQRPGQTPTTRPPSQLDPRSQGAAGAARGGIIGVMSKSTEPSLRVFNGRSKYNEWVFTPETLGIRVPGAGEGTPGGNIRGGAAGALGPGGRPVGPAGAPARGQIGIGPFGRPTQPQQPGEPPSQRPFGLPPQRPPR